MIRLEHSARAQAVAGLDHTQRPRRTEGQRLHDLAHACGAGQSAAQAEGHVCAQRQSDALQLFLGQVQRPQAIQPDQHRCRIRAAAAHAGADGDALLHMDMRAPAAACCALQRPRRPHRQMLLVRRQIRFAAAGQGQRVRRRDCHLVRQRHRLHQHIHEMIAVRPLTGDIQRPVDLRPRLNFHRSILPAYQFQEKSAKCTIPGSMDFTSGEAVIAMV